MQDPASFNLEAVKRQFDETINNKPGSRFLQSPLYPRLSLVG